MCVSSAPHCRSLDEPFKIWSVTLEHPPSSQKGSHHPKEQHLCSFIPRHLGVYLGLSNSVLLICETLSSGVQFWLLLLCRKYQILEIQYLPSTPPIFALVRITLSILGILWVMQVLEVFVYVLKKMPWGLCFIWN